MKRTRLKSRRRPLTAVERMAKDMPCTLEIVGICRRGELGQSVYCHLSGFGHGSMKRFDANGIFACSACHDVLDGRKGIADEYAYLDWRGRMFWYIARALVRTRQLIDERKAA